MQGFVKNRAGKRGRRGYRISENCLGILAARLVKLREDRSTVSVNRVGHFLPGGDVSVIREGRLRRRAEFIFLYAGDFGDDKTEAAFGALFITGSRAAGRSSAQFRTADAHGSHDESVLIGQDC